jgi:hypothetical protein
VLHQLRGIQICKGGIAVAKHVPHDDERRHLVAPDIPIIGVGQAYGLGVTERLEPFRFDADQVRRGLGGGVEPRVATTPPRKPHLALNIDTMGGPVQMG